MSSPTYAYYPGCSGLGTSKEYDRSTRAVCKALRVDLRDMPDWSCCGSTPAHTVDHIFSAALSARNLGIILAMGLNAATTPCPSCLTNLRTAEERMKKTEFGERVNKLLDAPYAGGVETKSVLQILVEDVGLEAIAAATVKPLAGLKVAAYYGCIMNRPPELMRFDDHENPMAMDRIMTAMGAEVVPFPLKVECCGASYGVARQDVTAKLSGRLLQTAVDAGADVIVTACPLCQMNLDLRQNQALKALGASFSIPTLYYTQLMGKALGLPEVELGFDKICVSPKQAFAAMGKAKEEKQKSSQGSRT